MRTRILADEAAAVAAAGTLLAEAVTGCPEPVLGLPTGRTMIPLYDELARRHAAGTIDLARARGFNLDELLLPPAHPATFHAYMARHAWERTGLREQRCDIPRLGAAALDECRRYDAALDECRRYDAALAACGGLDLAILGLGADGHVAYNLPGPPVSGTHVVALSESLADRLSVPPARRPLRAITLGFAAVRGARRLLVLATSADKARAVQQLVRGPADENWPCSLLREHPNLDVVLTAAAAALLPRRPC